MVERHLAKVEVAGSSPVIRSRNGYENRGFRTLFFNKIRRHSQAVRQRSAKPSSPVRFRVAPPTEKHPFGCFSVGGATLLSIALVAQSAANRFAFATRRSASSLARRRGSESSSKVKFRVYSKRKADPSGRLFCWRRHPFIDRARRAKRGEPKGKFRDLILKTAILSPVSNGSFTRPSVCWLTERTFYGILSRKDRDIVTGRKS